MKKQFKEMTTTEIINYCINEFTFSTKDAAQLFNVSPRTIRRWVKADKLKAVKVGRSIRFNETDLYNALDTMKYKKHFQQQL